MDIVREVPTLYREIASAQVPRMNQAILALADKNTDLVDTVLEILTFSASWFPTLFRPSIDKTEALCLRLLDGSMARTHVNTCSVAAQCLASLSAVGGKMTVEERWFQYTQLALGTIDLCIDHIMCKPSAESELNGSARHFEFAPFADNFIISIPQAVDRITSMTELLIALLSRPIDADIPIPADSLVSIASKLALIPLRVASAKSARAEFDLIPMLAPEIQRSSIRILATLAIALGNCMLPFLSAVARIVAIINTRHISSPATVVALHCLVQLYVQRYDYGFVVFLSKDFLESTILQDISVQSKHQANATTATVQASALNTSGGSKKRGGNGKVRAAEIPAGAEDLQKNSIHWTDVVNAGIKTITALLCHTPTVVSSSARTKLDAQILTLLMIDMIGGMEISFASRQTESSCKAALYECLEASVLSPDPWQKAILPHSLTVFNAGLSDSSPHVRNICLRAINAIEPLVHSRLPAQLRAPDTEKSYESEMTVPRAMFSDESTINRALTGMVIAESAEADLLNAKRYKQSETTEFQSQPQSQVSFAEETSHQTRSSSRTMPTTTTKTSFASVSATNSVSADAADSLSKSIIAHAETEARGDSSKPEISFASFATQPIQPAAATVTATSAAIQNSSFSAAPAMAADLSSTEAKHDMSAKTANATKNATTSSHTKNDNDANETDGFDNDEIPDIVMEGSDSEDED
ncbi:hypothetical protein J3B02_001111 [Coemansia erecta]|nr:hypothetical protein J3B02_001111 [Coemansia erecta]